MPPPVRLKLIFSIFDGKPGAVSNNFHANLYEILNLYFGAVYIRIVKTLTRRLDLDRKD